MSRSRFEINYSGTPSKRDKYDNYTPRKRYVKDQQESYSYRHKPEDLRCPQSSHFDRRNLSSSRRQIVQDRRQDMFFEADENQVLTFRPQDTLKVSIFEEPSQPLEECTSMINNRNSFRKERLKKDRQYGRRQSFGNQNQNGSNFHKQKFIKMEMDTLAITPRKQIPKKEGPSLAEKMSSLQNKIARLEKMTPQRPSTPRSSRVSESRIKDSSVTLFQREDSQKTIQSLVVQDVSQRQNELLSRVSLGRLVEQEQAQNEVEVIQDLSYKISNKLKSIIRHFG